MRGGGGVNKFCFVLSLDGIQVLIREAHFFHRNVTGKREGSEVCNPVFIYSLKSFFFFFLQGFSKQRNRKVTC